jgi:hypothetical protein
MEDNSCHVSPEGDKITIAVSSEAGSPQDVTLSFDQASALAMTLPRLLTMALRRRFPDASLRHVYPALEYAVECASDLQHVLLTLSCGGGFDMVFGLHTSMIETLMEDLADGQDRLQTASSVRPN